MRRGVDFLRRNIGVAGDPVLRSRTAALPLVSIGEPDREVGTGAGEMQRTEPLSVQPLAAAAQYFVVRLPGRDGVIPVDARRREDGIGKLSDRDVFFILWKHELGPRRRRISNDVPV